MKRRIAYRQAGVTLTELLVVLVIVSILSTIAVPVYINKATQAKIAVAEAECREIADAEEACFIAHNLYVPLQVLDDLPANSTQNTNSDSIDHEPSGLFAIDPNKSISMLQTNQPQMSLSSTDQRVVNMLNHWIGPFLNPARVFLGTGNSTTKDPATLTGGLNQQDYPLDPWGQPYRFYSPLGLIGSSANQTLSTAWLNVSFSDGMITTVDSQRLFDRFAIVSYGPDGVSNTQTQSGDQLDDIIYFFGRVRATETTFIPTTSTPTPTPVPTP